MLGEVGGFSFEAPSGGLFSDSFTTFTLLLKDRARPIQRTPLGQVRKPAEIRQPSVRVRLLYNGPKVWKGISNEPGHIPTGWTGGLYWIIKGFGGDYWTPDLKTAMISDPKTVQAITFVRDLMWKDKVAPSASTITGLGLDMETAFASGKIALHYALNDASFRMNEAIAGKFKWTVCPTPTGPAGRFQFSGGSAFAIPTSSRMKEVAYELTRFVLANPDNLPTTAVMGGALVANMDFAEFGLPPKSSGIQDAFRHAAIEMGKKNPCMPNYHAKYLDWETTVWPLMDPIWNGEANGDITPIITKVQDGTQKILDELAKM